MEVKIGIHSVPRELVVDTDTSAEEVERLLSAALDKGEHAVFALSLTKGGRVLVPADKIAYVEFGGAEARRVGFGNIVLYPVAASGGPGEGAGPAPGIVDND
jgi:Protein of unknown function (DUF3107)